MFINDHSNERQYHTLSFDTKFVNVQQIFPKIFQIFIFQPGDQSHGIAHKQIGKPTSLICSSARFRNIETNMEEEFNAIFDLLDPSFRGSIDCDQLQEFHVAFYFAPMHRDQIKMAVDQIGGKEAKGRCDRKNFLALLFELERRKTVEENAWWDFKALDTKDQDRISIKETLLLFKVIDLTFFYLVNW